MKVAYINHPQFLTLSIREALTTLLDEVVEFVQEPSRDEASDIAFGVGRLLGALLGRKYVPVWGDTQHIAKCNARYLDYGHFRSKRHIQCSFCGQPHTADGYSTCLH